MEFLHDGRPPVIRDATYEPPTDNQVPLDPPKLSAEELNATLLGVLGQPERSQQALGHSPVRS